MDNMTLSEQIKKLRTAKKMTLAVMAERTGVTISTISAYENGTRTPSLDALIKIAKLFNVTTDYLLGISKGKDLINISLLTGEQRDLVQQMISHFYYHNYILEKSTHGTSIYEHGKYISKEEFEIMLSKIDLNDEEK